MPFPNFLRRLFSSLIIGGQAFNFIFRGEFEMIYLNSWNWSVVLIWMLLDSNIKSSLTSMGVSSEIGGLLQWGWQEKWLLFALLL